MFMVNSSVEHNFESQYVIFPDYWLGATTVLFWSVYRRSYSICTHTELFKTEREGENNAIVRNQCAYTLQQNRLSSSGLPDESQSLVLQSFIMDIWELCGKCSSMSRWVLSLSSSKCVASTVPC